MKGKLYSIGRGEFMGYMTPQWGEKRKENGKKDNPFFKKPSTLKRIGVYHCCAGDWPPKIK